MKYIVTLALLFAFSGVTLRAQEDEIKEKIASFKTATKKKIPADQIHYMEWFAKSWEKVDPKSRKVVHGLAKKNLKSKEKEVLEKTVAFLAQMGGGTKNKDGDRAAGILYSECQKKTTEKDVKYYAAVVKSLGKLQSLKQLKGLTKLLNYKENMVVAASGEALANYRDFKNSIRKDIVSSVLKMYTSTSNQSRDPRNRVAKEKLQVIGASMELCLRSLTGQNKSGADNWWKWWNDVGKKSTKW